jgi:cytochrome c oxidase subunit 2
MRWLRSPRPAAIALRRWPLPIGAAALGGCTGAQSALDPAGSGAARIAELFWWMTGGALAIWAAMVALAVYAIWSRRRPHDERRAKLLIVAGGVAFPTVVLAALLTYGLALLPALVAPAPPGSLVVEVLGLQWWWRVRYPARDGAPVELANELRLPVGEPVELRLESGDVIHSLWIPALGGKTDMIPGRRTRLVLHPTRIGTFRGICAEYCGSSHARMAFDVHVLPRDEFERWLARQAEPAQQPREELAASGAELFRANGCGACHSIRGTPSAGGVGPDLTHVGGRTSLAAGSLDAARGALERWLAEPERIKPGALMPAFHMLPEGELEALAAYLESLR